MPYVWKTKCGCLRAGYANPESPKVDGFVVSRCGRHELVRLLPLLIIPPALAIAGLIAILVVR